jgi:hypothetical protein
MKKIKNCVFMLSNIAIGIVCSVGLIGCGDNWYIGESSPTAITLPPVSVGSNYAILHGSVYPNGHDTQVWFEWGTDSSLDQHAETDTQWVYPSGDNSIGFSVQWRLDGLIAGETYYYRIVAIHNYDFNYGISTGGIISFKTN